MLVVPSTAADRSRFRHPARPALSARIGDRPATVPLKDVAATQRQNPGQRPVSGIQPGHLREHALRAAHHPPGVRVVGLETFTTGLSQQAG